MKKTVKFVEPVFRFAAVSYLTSCLLLGNTNPPKDDDDKDDAVFHLSPFEINTGGGGYAPSSTIAGTRISSAQMGATAGGAQDINLARMEVLQGNIPRPDTFTPEGLFSEHDLPIQVEARPGQLLSIGGEAMRASILGVPRARVLAQIGFASGLDARTWQRQPLNLVAVVDKSGSMSGQPLELVKQSLREVVQQLGENDQLSIVLYGDHAHVSMPPTILSKENRKQVLSEIASIVSNGSTAMEHGLQVGYQVAEHSSRTFEGTTRLMLFTDEQPNVGNTAASGFMGQMREGSKKGFGLTTIGVGVHFGAELANKISAVRGGNLFYFPDYMTMVNTFEEDFDTMVTELAYDMMVTIKPEHDWKIEAVYGIPANMLKWLPDDSLRFRVETLFLSKRKGAIYFALAPKRSESGSDSLTRLGDSVAQVDLQYIEAGAQKPTRDSVDFVLADRKQAGVGLSRGEVLISHYAGLKQATTDFHSRSDVYAAFRTMKSLTRILRGSRDSALSEERKMAENLTDTLAGQLRFDSILAGSRNDSPVTGVWHAYVSDNVDIETDMILTLSGERTVELAAYDDEGYIDELRYGIAEQVFSKYHSGKIKIQSFEDLDPFDYELPDGLEETSYLKNVHSIKYKINGSRMDLRIYRKNQSSPLEITLWRSEDPQDGYTFNNMDEVSVDPISGLPVR